MSNECKSNKPAFCRYHGDSKKIAFETRLKVQLSHAQKQLEESGDDVHRFMEARAALDEAELQYAATMTGEEELREKIANAAWPENEVLEQKLTEALKLRQQLEDDDSEEGIYSFPASRLEEAKKRIDKANRKLERAGVEERFTYTVEEYIEEDADGHKFAMVSLEMSNPKLKVSGWDFVAAVDRTPDGGVITRVLPNQDLGEGRPESLICEHCGRARHRKTTYMLRNSEGEYKQVGSGCLSSFLGVEPKGLWALNYDMDVDSSLIGGKPEFGGADTVFDLQEVVATGLAASDNGQTFVTASSANEYGGASTADRVRKKLFGTLRDEKIEVSEEHYAAAREMIANTTIDGETEYARNMRTVLGSTNLSVKHIGMAVSVIAAANREKWKQEREAAKALEVKSVGYLAEVGAKVSNLDLTVKRVDYYEGSYGTQTRIIMTAPDGKEVLWTASGYRSAEAGDNIQIKSATVKNHRQFNDNDQTVLTRARINEPSDEE